MYSDIQRKLYLFPSTVVTKSHKLGKLKQQKCNLSDRRLKIWKQGVHRAGFFWSFWGESVLCPSPSLRGLWGPWCFLACKDVTPGSTCTSPPSLCPCASLSASCKITLFDALPVLIQYSLISILILITSAKTPYTNKAFLWKGMCVCGGGDVIQATAKE